MPKRTDNVNVIINRLAYKGDVIRKTNKMGKREPLESQAARVMNQLFMAEKCANVEHAATMSAWRESERCILKRVRFYARASIFFACACVSLLAFVGWLLSI